MGNSVPSDRIIALGRKLVEELGLEPSVDTLGRWMAHYIADLMARAEGASGEEKIAAESNCFDAILALWQHRAELPNGKRPFEKLEPVIRTVESLDLDSVQARYYRSVNAPKAEGEEESEAESWLRIVNALDSSAKILIGYCLGEAAEAALDKTKEWVKLAEAAGAEEDVPEIVLRFVSSNADLGRGPDLNSEIRQQLQDRIGRLEFFATLAETVVADFKTRLEKLPPSADDPA